MRLKCLSHVVASFSSDNKKQMEIIPQIIGGERAKRASFEKDSSE